MRPNQRSDNLAGEAKGRFEFAQAITALKFKVCEQLGPAIHPVTIAFDLAVHRRSERCLRVHCGPASDRWLQATRLGVQALRTDRFGPLLVLAFRLFLLLLGWLVRRPVGPMHRTWSRHGQVNSELHGMVKALALSKSTSSSLLRGHPSLTRSPFTAETSSEPRARCYDSLGSLELL